jgi:TolA-binding protein
MSLNRKDIEAYLNSDDPKFKNTIEKSALSDEFDNAALDGWNDFPEAKMNRLDKRYTKQSFWGIKITIAVLLALTGAFIIYNFQSKDDSQKNIRTTLKENKTDTVILEKTDYIIPQPIKEMDELPVKKQIQVATIIKDFKEKSIIAETKPNQLIEINLPTKKIESESSPSRSIVQETFLGKEIYLFDLKVIDYRFYRAKPEITTKQTLLTGTPANLGEIPTEESSEWENIEIPYIEYLSKTMEYFSKGQNKRALTRFLEIINTYPDDLNANFYAGLCYYNLKEYSSAINHFGKCSNSDFKNFIEESDWYKAKCYIANNQQAEAKELLNQIVAGKGYYANQASKLLH